jgi:hypothetical protein
MPDSPILRWGRRLLSRPVGWVWGEPGQRWWRVGLVVGLLALVVPLLGGRLLPFHDAPGIIGLGGALGLRDDPAARVRELYDIDIRAYPSSLYFGWAYLAGTLGVPMDVAFSLFTALFSLWGPLLATLLLLSAFGRPLHLALLVLPVGYHHQIWFGFLGSSAAITGIILAIAFARRIIDRPSLGNHLGLAGALLFLAAAHPFPLALTLAAIAPLLLWPTGARRPSQTDGVPRSARSTASRALLSIAGRLATLVPMVVFLLGWIASFFGGRGGEVSFFRRVLAEVPLRPPELFDARLFVEWLGNGYKTGWDELVPLLALLTLAPLLALGTRPANANANANANERTAAPPRSRDLLPWVGLGWPVALFAAGYLFLPMKLMWPEFWWGVRVRCVMPLYLLLIALPRVRPRGLPPWATAPAAAAGLLLLGYIAYDFSSTWRGRYLPGFEQAIAAIPPGRSVLAFPAMPDPHYTRGHPYLAQAYVAQKGGRVVPYLGGHPGSYWITMKPPPPSPPWGDPAAFVWEQHAAGWDYFLLELPAGRPPPPDPMQLAPPGSVEVASAAGRWILWRKRTPRADTR